jgi:hypothetical protein
VEIDITITPIAGGQQQAMAAVTALSSLGVGVPTARDIIRNVDCGAVATVRIRTSHVSATLWLFRYLGYNLCVNYLTKTAA